MRAHGWGSDRHWPLSQVQEYIADLVTEYFKDDVEVVMRDPILFGDFRMALHEEEERIYEDIQDYEAAKALFQVRAGGVSSGGFRVLGCVGMTEECVKRRPLGSP